MGQQQMLLIILGVIIVGLGIAVGLILFGTESIQDNKDAMINDLNIIAAQAYQWRIRPAFMGGGNRVYTNKNGGTAFSIPKKMKTNENATYSIQSMDDNNVTIYASSVSNPGCSITVTIGSDGKLSHWSYGGDFNDE